MSFKGRKEMRSAKVGRGGRREGEKKGEIGRDRGTGFANVSASFYFVYLYVSRVGKDGEGRRDEGRERLAHKLRYVRLNPRARGEEEREEGREEGREERPFCPAVVSPVSEEECARDEEVEEEEEEEEGKKNQRKRQIAKRCAQPVLAGGMDGEREGRTIRLEPTAQRQYDTRARSKKQKHPRDLPQNILHS